jgi:hypothetical protein
MQNAQFFQGQFCQGVAAQAPLLQALQALQLLQSGPWKHGVAEDGYVQM